jgi:hypothetical protein
MHMVTTSEPPSMDEIVTALESGKVLRGIADGVQMRLPQPASDPGDATLAEPAVDESGEPWMYIEHVNDPDFEFDLEVGFSDAFARDHDEEIERAVSFLRSVPGVESAFREDPEQIVIIGTRDARRIRDILLGWWNLPG